MQLVGYLYENLKEILCVLHNAQPHQEAYILHHMYKKSYVSPYHVQNPYLNHWTKWIYMGL
jgi:hypothetical protein